MSKSFYIAIAIVILGQLIVLGSNLYDMSYKHGVESCDKR